MSNEERKTFMRSRPEAAEIVYRDFKESERVTFQIAADYGRWLIASLLLIHGGALVALFSFLDAFAADEGKLRAFAPTVWAFAIGLFLALATGFFTWLNWSMHAENFSQMARYEMLWDPDEWLAPAPYTGWLTATYWMSIAAGWASAIAMLVGLWMAVP